MLKFSYNLIYVQRFAVYVPSLSFCIIYFTNTFVQFGTGTAYIHYKLHTLEQKLLYCLTPQVEMHIFLQILIRMYMYMYMYLGVMLAKSVWQTHHHHHNNSLYCVDVYMKRVEPKKSIVESTRCASSTCMYQILKWVVEFRSQKKKHKFSAFEQLTQIIFKIQSRLHQILYSIYNLVRSNLQQNISLCM